MTEEKTKQLFDRFPKFFYPNLPETVNLMSFGFSCNDGWFDLIWQLCLDIEKANPSEDFIVFQVKEKFAGLRFYTENSNDEIENIIYLAEVKSYKICEYCGSEQDVTIVKTGWLKTLCSSCKEKK